MDMGTYWSGLGVAIAVGFGGVAMMQFSPPKWMIARACFSIAVLFWFVADFVWELTTPMPFGMRLIGGVGTAFVIGSLFPILLIWAQRD
jgi:hypothetical protein